MTASATVAYNNMLSQGWVNLYNILNNRANIADPSNVQGANRKFIYAREPETQSVDFSGYPFIILNPATMGLPSRITGDRKKRLNTWRLDGEIRASDEDPAPFAENLQVDRPKGMGMQQLSQIADDLAKTLNTVSVRNTLAGYGMFNVEIEFTSFDENPIDGQTVYIRGFTITFDKYMDVTQ